MVYWVHYLLFPPLSFFLNERRTLLSTIRTLDSKLLDSTDYDLTQTLLFGNISQTSSNSFKIINASIDYILSSKKFDEPFFWINFFISSSVNPNLINIFLFYNRHFSVLHIHLLLLVILYSQVLSSIMVSGDSVILFVCVFLSLHEVKCKYIYIYIYWYYEMRVKYCKEKF